MFKAGFARVDVTPPLKTELTGYFEKRISDGVLDPIELNAVAISFDDNIALIITADFMYTSEKSITRYRELIANDTDIDKNRIIIQSVHQHTSTTPGVDGVTDLHYQDFLERKFCDVAKMAAADLKQATISIAQKETATPISFVRRFKMKDGSTRTNPGRLNPDIVCPIGNADNTVRLVKFERENSTDIALVSFQTHPDVIGGNKFSADWSGFARRFTEADIENTNCILVNGCQGDVNHINVNSEISLSGYSHSRFMGRTIADTVIDLWDKTEEARPSQITAEVVTKHIPSNANGADRIEECIEIQTAYNNKTLGRKLEMGEHGEINRIIRMENVPLVQRVPVSIIAFGKIVLIGFAGEPFTEYATVLREAFPELFILTACLANGAQGYLVSSAAFEEGGYEARASSLSSVVAEALQSTAKELIKKHAAKIQYI